MKEEEYLQLIEGKLEAAIENIKDEMKLNDKDIAQLQELYWENNSDFDEYGYEEYENRQQMFNILFCAYKIIVDTYYFMPFF